MTPSLSNSSDLTESLSKLNSLPEKNQLPFIQTLAEQGEDGLAVLISFLRDRVSQPPTLAAGKAYQALFTSDSTAAAEFLQSQLPHGIVPLTSAQGIDYSLLHKLLAAQEFETADRLTLEKLCELAGELAVKRKWIYFTEVKGLPVADLQTINALWFFYSEGKFGFSVQRELWLGVGQNWEKLWPKIGWKRENVWTRYPQEFTWDLTAPRGHLPLSNQLRGVQVINALLTHPAWG